jgi:hypothetical protein
MKPWSMALGAGLALALVQQQILLRQPPRLQTVKPASASSGPGALEITFSRPMAVPTIASSSQISPAAAHQWLGSGNRLRLLLQPGVTVNRPLSLTLRGRDLRSMPMAPRLWRWDPRPRIVAVVGVAGGEQVQLQDHDGSWQPLSPIWPSIPTLQPLGDGSGIAMVSADPMGRQQVWRLELVQHNLAPGSGSPSPPSIGRFQQLSKRPLLFAYLSSNRQGDLLVQGASETSGQAESELWSRSGRKLAVPVVQDSGPIKLVPQGGAMVVPEGQGLSLVKMTGPSSARQMLPGSRDLSSFCPVGGRALLVHHRPDFTRSLEIVEPGQPPRSIWQGPQALVASACDRNGARIWALTIEGVGLPRLRLLALDRQGHVLRQRDFQGWALEPGTGLQLDPSRNQLLMTVRPLVSGPGRPEARPALVNATTLEFRVLDHPVLQAMWLVAG